MPQNKVDFDRSIVLWGFRVEGKGSPRVDTAASGAFFVFSAAWLVFSVRYTSSEDLSPLSSVFFLSGAFFPSAYTLCPLLREGASFLLLLVVGSALSGGAYSPRCARFCSFPVFSGFLCVRVRHHFFFPHGDDRRHRWHDASVTCSKGPGVTVFSSVPPLEFRCCSFGA